MTGITELLEKERSKGNIVNNYNLLTSSVKVNDRYNCKYDLWIFRLAEFIARRTEMMLEKVIRYQ